MLSEDLIKRYIRPLKPIPTGLAPAGHLEGDIRCILFDIYGTLLISGSGDIGTEEKAQLPAAQIKDLLQRYEIDIPPLQINGNLERAISQRHAQAKRRGIDFPEVQIEAIWKEILGFSDLQRGKRFALEWELCTNPVYPMPHAARLLRAIKESGRITGIISNAQFYTPLILERLLGDDLKGLGFARDLIFFSYHLGYAKPSARLFEQASKATALRRLPPDSVLYIGNDMLKDIAPAKRAGFQSVLFAGDKRSLRLRAEDPRCQGIKPDLIVTDLLQVLDYI